MTKHFTFGGSTAKRTINCPAWVGLSKNIPSAPASAAASLGTALHKVIEMCIDDVDLDPVDFVDVEVEGVVLTTENIAVKILPALDAFEDLIEDYALEFKLEVTFKLTEEVGGTPDFIGWNAENNVVVVADYKSGDGILVDAEGSDQLLFYTRIAIAKLPELGFITPQTKLIMVIVQPTERRDYVTDKWEADIKTLNDWTIEFDRALHASKDTSLAPNAGNWCKFCPAEATCPAKTGEAQQALRLPIESMELAALTDAMKIVGNVENWAKAVRKLAHEQAEQGVKIDGWKLVNKRASRVWNDTDGVSQKLKKLRGLTADDYSTTKLLSPAQLEKICKLKDVDFVKFTDYISSISSGTTLAKLSDKRVEIVTTAALKAIADRL